MAGCPGRAFLLDSLAGKLGLDRREVSHAFHWLRDEGIAELLEAGPALGITDAGVRAIDEGRSRAQSDAPGLVGTQVNVIHVERMENSQIQQGVSDGQQTYCELKRDQ